MRQNSAQPPIQGDDRKKKNRLLILSLTALGVVYGDIGTSPLYAIRECFHGEYGITPAPDNVLGVLSLMFWSLVIVVSIKYLVFVLRADNQGEGGVIALTALMGNVMKGRGGSLVAIGLFAGALLYGDGMITPAISVLSAVEGMSVVAPVLQPLVVPVTIAILVGIFLLQRRGTAKIGVLFGPVTFVWLLTIGGLGVMSLIDHPQVMGAINPWYGARFLIVNKLHGFVVLGAVFLVVTGTEALYADMGHFGRRPIRLTWFVFVFPMLLLNYFGQGAKILASPETASHPFYALAPSWMTIPLVILATMATIIASQAVISGAFSLTRQAIQLGYLPRMRIVHTSYSERGQIYIPQVNWLLMVGTIALVLGFQSSSSLAAAYGVAVTTTMTVTSILFFVVARRIWHWNLAVAALPVLLFLVVDLSFFGANISKIAHGAWFPLVIGGCIYLVFTTWKKGRAILAGKLYDKNPTVEAFVDSIRNEKPYRIRGKAVFMAGSRSAVPPALLLNFKHNRVLHKEIVILTVITEEIPRVKTSEKVHVQELGAGFCRVVAHYGYMEHPSIPQIASLAREQGIDIDLKEASFFIGREHIAPDRQPLMSLWREKIFAFLSQNASGATAFFDIPPKQVIEIGAQVEV